MLKFQKLISVFHGIFHESDNVSTKSFPLTPKFQVKTTTSQLIPDVYYQWDQRIL